MGIVARAVVRAERMCCSLEPRVWAGALAPCLGWMARIALSEPLLCPCTKQLHPILTCGTGWSALRADHWDLQAVTRLPVLA
jgi:hypothetical protein